MLVNVYQGDIVGYNRAEDPFSIYDVSRFVTVKFSNPIPKQAPAYPNAIQAHLYLYFELGQVCIHRVRSQWGIVVTDMSCHNYVDFSSLPPILGLQDTFTDNFVVPSAFVMRICIYVGVVFVGLVLLLLLVRCFFGKPQRSSSDRPLVFSLASSLLIMGTLFALTMHYAISVTSEQDEPILSKVTEVSGGDPIYTQYSTEYGLAPLMFGLAMLMIFVMATLALFWNWPYGTEDPDYDDDDGEGGETLKRRLYSIDSASGTMTSQIELTHPYSSTKATKKASTKQQQQKHPYRHHKKKHSEQWFLPNNNRTVEEEEEDDDESNSTTFNHNDSANSRKRNPMHQQQSNQSTLFSFL